MSISVSRNSLPAHPASNSISTAIPSRFPQPIALFRAHGSRNDSVTTCNCCQFARYGWRDPHLTSHVVAELLAPAHFLSRQLALPFLALFLSPRLVVRRSRHRCAPWLAPSPLVDSSRRLPSVRRLCHSLLRLPLRHVSRGALRQRLDPLGLCSLGPPLRHVPLRLDPARPRRQTRSRRRSGPLIAAPRFVKFLSLAAPLYPEP